MQFDLRLRNSDGHTSEDDVGVEEDGLDGAIELGQQERELGGDQEGGGGDGRERDGDLLH